MKFQMQNQPAFILNTLVELLPHFSRQEQASYSQIIEFSLAEMVREMMRSIAAQGDNPGERQLLEQAIQRTEQQVQERVPNQVEFDFAPYLAALRQGLRYPAKEMAELGVELKRSRQVQRTSRTEQLTSASGVPFEVLEVGLPKAIELLIAYPLVETIELDLGPLRESYRVEGEGFPFQVTAQELTFAIDDDGSIFTCVENFPIRLVANAKEELMALARQVYLSRA
ncbi:MAG TPA: hypothetical protein V6C84_30220 [Coleofasciculaceae cyanobacterium]|jgi:hypothetical protein